MLRLAALRRHFSSTPKLYRYYFNHAHYIVPHPEKAHKGGEDAVYTSDNVLLVADGVGGWAESGVDPALYSKKLAAIVGELLAKESLRYIENPKQLIKEAVELNKEVGSTTVCVLTLHPQLGSLNAYYLGDSVYSIINPTNESYRIAPDQQYSFNFPVQIGTNGADPLSGVLHNYKEGEILPEEVIAIGTDGIWDNLHDYMIYKVVADKEGDLKHKAKLLASLAERYGSAGNYESPFHLKAKEAGLNYPKQGKLDDNSIILAQVIKQEI